MDTEFVRDRITKLRIQRNLSEREMSLSLGKAHNYIQSVSSGKIKPTIESLLDICDYLEISPSDFFNSDNDKPILTSSIIKESIRISSNDLETFLNIIKLFEPEDFQAYINRLKKYKLNQ